jgi:[protein-PII] uridylyltransferase
MESETEGKGAGRAMGRGDPRDRGEPEAEREALPAALGALTASYLARHREPLRLDALAGTGGTSLAHRGAAVFDGLLSALFCGAQARFGLTNAPIALLAVGGYGRGTVALGSDLDILVLAEDPTDARVRALLDAVLYPLWDAGVSVGHAARSASEFVQLAREDLRTATTVLDARWLAGDGAHAREAIARGWRALFDGDVNHFLDGLEAEMQGRHARFGASVYLLEPDLKHGRGALRDLDIARWALGARYRAGSFRDALRRGFVSEGERQRLDGALEFYWRARCAMHAAAGRRADRLTFDAQEECARALGFVTSDTGEGAEVDPVARGAERLMQAYYGHARTVATTLELLLERCRVGRTSHERVLRAERLAEGVDRFDGTVTLAEGGGLERDPVCALRLVECAIQTGLPLSSRAREAISRAASETAWCERLRGSAHAGAVFLRLLTHAPRARLRQRGSAVSAAEQGPASVLAELHDLGLLLAMIPEFAPVTGRVHHDVYHVYTVDVHSVAAVDRLHEMARGEHAEAFDLAARVLADVERRDLLCLATLLHDVGKGRRGDHSAVGAAMAIPIAARLGLAPSDAEQVAWLVSKHLALYHVATRRDLSDPDTIAPVAAMVGSVWRSRALYLLTVADLSTTSPTSMTSWKARMLDELHRRTEEALAGDGEGAEVAPLAERALALAGDARGAVRALLSELPGRYARAMAPEAIVRHAAALDGAPPGRPMVRVHALQGEGRGELLEVLVCAPDRPGLLARLASMLTVCRLDVQGAQLFARRREGSDEALDVFVARRLDEDPGGLERLEARLPIELERALSGPVPERGQTTGGFRRAEPQVRTEVAIDNDASGRFTVIELFGRDRPGLLHAIASALFRLGLSIASAKVNTEGRRAADVFYVLEADGAKVSPARFDAIRDELRRALL